MTEYQRRCGDCYACCVHIGIKELRKWAGQTCKHLDGSCTEGRCGIYRNRPEVCVSYECLWLQGHFTEQDRPKDSGFFAQQYDDEHVKGTSIVVFDEGKCGPLAGGAAGALRAAVDEVAAKSTPMIQIIYMQSRRVVYFAPDGKVYRGRMLPAKAPEDQSFNAEETPIGTWKVKDKELVTAKGDTDAT